MEALRNYIGGQLIAPAGGRYLDNVDPATGAVYGQVPDSGPEDVDRAVAAAAEAFSAWSRTPAAERSAVLLRVADLIDRDRELFARAECVDNGKPLALARSVDIPRASTNLRFFATRILHAQSESHLMEGMALNYTLRQPRGVCGLISPWNLPLYLFTWKIAPALAAGNTAVGKPSEITPVTAGLLAERCVEAGLPAGVLNIVHGRGAEAGAALVAHPDVATISFTGGTRTGQEIARVAAPMFKKISLELGGKNPNIVFADADLDAALAGSLRAAFANQGQICLCGSRLLVQRSIYDAFTARFVEGAERMRVGDPLEATTDVGALVSEPHLEKVASYVELARSEGGSIACGGTRATVAGRCAGGFFFPPTVITSLGPQCRVNQEEIFGPVVTVIPFDDESEALAIANGTAYGLSASVWTRDLEKAHRVSADLHAGTVWVNCWLLRDLRVPFGGVKQSGVGREGGEEAMRFFTEPKNVCIRVTSEERA